MKKLLLFLCVVFIGVFSSCKKGTHSYEGTFISEDNAKFELHSDSTTSIIFPDAQEYTGIWKIVKADDGMEWANIEFAGNQEYFYLYNENLYRSERNMRHQFMGSKVTYQD